jgi:hypothetical protein
MSAFISQCAAIAISISTFGLCVYVSQAQNAPATEAPKPSAELRFNLGKHEPTVSKIVEIIRKQDYERRTLELAAMNTDSFTKAINLLRFIPLRLSTGPDDDFLMPDYLRRSYNRPSPEVHLFNAP